MLGQPWLKDFKYCLQWLESNNMVLIYQVQLTLYSNLCLDLVEYTNRKIISERGQGGGVGCEN